MKLSIVIVNYNVKYFLEQCLLSVQKAIQNIDAEIFVVDNNSVDGSCSMVKQKFPGVALIENKKNTGFSIANNQAIRLLIGEYVLLLNPDTLVQEDTFSKVISFMDQHPEAGGLGVKMIDGKGEFLPESKRGLPTPAVAFYKIFGLSKLFPESKIFGKYHLGYLNREEVNEVEILSGAFMLLRKKVLDEIGLLDESFFMYGEDIDLSYRIIKAGYKNYYFPETTIIHYKGESTKKGSLNYVLVFYNAMIIFARKHFSSKNADLFSFFINMAVYFRAGLSMLKRIVLYVLLPLTDALMIFAGYFFILPYWENYRFPQGGNYPPFFLTVVVPVYIFVWLLSVYLSGGYQNPIKISRILKGLGLGTVIILLVYSLLSEEFRFSRALIIIGTGWAFVTIMISRFLLHHSGIQGFRLYDYLKRKVGIIGSSSEADRVISILGQSETQSEIIGFIMPNSNNLNNHQNIINTPLIGNISQLKEIISINKLDEIIFCSKDISSQEIIRKMLELSDIEVEYKIVPEESISIIGSNSIYTSDNLYTININSIAKGINRRYKRLLDIFFAILFILAFPLVWIVIKNPLGLLKNCISVFCGFKTWVAYYNCNQIEIHNLPPIKKGVLTPLDSQSNKNLSKSSIERLNTLYAKNYHVFIDLSIILKGFRLLGRP